MQGEALLWLALKAIAIAAVPLAYVYFSRDPQKLRKLAWVTAFLTFDLIMFGSFTRLTDSGLGCPDWPGCYGHSNPLSAGEEIRAAESALPSGPVTMTKAWIEMLHRYFAMAVGFLIIVLMVMAWRRFARAPTPQHRSAAVLATVVLAAVCLQGAFGAWTVTMKLQPAIVTAHLLGGMSLLALLVWQALREETPRVVGPGAARLRPLAIVAFLILAVQIALGGWVSTNYAVMACPDFPLCHGKLVPAMDFRHGFTVWRDLGMTPGGEPIPFQALVAIHWVHRHFAYVAFAVLAWLAFKAWNVPGLTWQARALALTLVVQFLTGLSNVVLQWPLALAVAHNGGAAVLVALLVTFNFRVARARQAGPAG